MASCQPIWTFPGRAISFSNWIATLGWRVLSLLYQKLWRVNNPGFPVWKSGCCRFHLVSSYLTICHFHDVIDRDFVFLQVCCVFIVLFLFSYSGFQNVSTFYLVGGFMMMIRFSHSSSKRLFLYKFVGLLVLFPPPLISG